MATQGPASTFFLATLVLTSAFSCMIQDLEASSLPGKYASMRRQLDERGQQGPQVLEYSDEATHTMLDDAGGPVNVFLIWTTDASTFDELATQCIDSVIKTYGSRVRLFANHLQPEDLRARGWQEAVLVRYHPEQVVMDTPLYRFFVKRHEEIKSGPYFFSHLSDFMRLALMYKHGGLYFDADVLVLRPVSDAYRNRLIVHPWDSPGPNNHSSIESAIMFHDAGDPYLFEVMRLITRSYNPGWWVAAAAWPLTEVYQKVPLHSLTRKPGLIPTGAFFGLHYWTGYDFWDKGIELNMNEFVGCEVVHLWGSVARGYHHKRKEADYMRTPENIQRVRDRLAYLRNVGHCQPNAPHATDLPQDSWLPGPIKNRRLSAARRRALAAGAGAAAVGGHPISVQEYDKL